MRTLASALIAFVSLLLSPLAALAHTLDVPETVVANEDGSFSFQAVFTAGPGTATVASTSWFGVENVAGGLVADCFCSPGCILEEGEELLVFVDGALTDPAAPGLVSVDVGFCDAPTMSAEVEILPFQTPPIPICVANDDCAAVEFCRTEPGACGETGLCAQRPEACPLVFDPVCGCDGSTHGNDCEAALAGVSVAFAGPCELEVEIDIKPGSDPNAINPLGQGLIPVALLGAIDVDVMDVDPETLAFGPDGAPISHEVGPHVGDVNDDGFTDLVVHFRTQDTGIAWGQTHACVAGETFDGTPIEGCDSIVTVGSCGIGFELVLVLPPLMWLYRSRRRSRA